MSCCAPCSAGAMTELVRAGESRPDFVVLFYNPQIFPKTEYQKRLDEQIKYCESKGVRCVSLCADDYETEYKKWLDAVKGLEREPERGLRCAECFKFRFAFALKWAKENGFDGVASVLGVSRHKSQAMVDAAAKNVLKDSGIEYVPIKWDEALRQEINKERDFYRQNYCGCEYSVRRNP